MAIAFNMPTRKKSKTAYSSIKELSKLKRNGENDREVVFRLVRVMAQIWQIHPFRESNTRSVIVFALLWANAMGLQWSIKFSKPTLPMCVMHLWASQGIYSKYESLERIFFDAILHEDTPAEQDDGGGHSKYEQIGDYKVKDYKERPHEYVDDKK